MLKEKLKYAIKNSRSEKAAGPDKVPADLLKLISESSIDVILKLFNNIYEMSKILSYWLALTFVTLLKTNRARECSSHRIIALISHILKILEQDINDTQIGFWKSVETKEWLFGLKLGA